MRPIKYRAWHKQYKKIYNVDYLHFSPDGDLFGLLSVEIGKLLPIDDFEVMQFTGLLDKNDKEIYEGDIVRDARWGNLFEVVWCDGKGENLGNQVGWHLCDEKFCQMAHIEDLVAYHDINDDPDREDYYNGVVVGNIHEHPELLEVK